MFEKQWQNINQMFCLWRSRLEGETDHRREISILQSRISEYEQSQSSVEARFQQLKEEASAQECKRQEEYSHKVQQLTQEVLRAKREFEEHLQVMTMGCLTVWWDKACHWRCSYQEHEFLVFLGIALFILFVIMINFKEWFHHTSSILLSSTKIVTGKVIMRSLASISWRFIKNK